METSESARDRGRLRGRITGAGRDAVPNGRDEEVDVEARGRHAAGTLVDGRRQMQNGELRLLRLQLLQVGHVALDVQTQIRHDERYRQPKLEQLRPGIQIAGPEHPVSVLLERAHHEPPQPGVGLDDEYARAGARRALAEGGHWT